MPGRSGSIIPARATAAIVAALAAGQPAAAHPGNGIRVGEINVYEAHNPQATARAVRDELRRLAADQRALLSD